LVSGVPDFFISYNSQDDRWAQWIAWELEAAGYSVIVQAWDFAPGSNFVLEMQKAAASSARTIAVLSPSFVASAFTQPEWAAAFAQDPTGAQRRLVPVRVAPVELTGLLAQIVHVDLVGASETSARQRLLETAGVVTGRATPGRAKPSGPPGFPGSADSAAPAFPNERPDVWQVPRASRGFHGRDDLLAEITTTMAREPVVILSGLGGSGKSRLALKYVHDLRANYDVVYWVRAEDPTTMMNDLARLALQLGLTEVASPDRTTMLPLVHRWLETNARWCLVFDNAADPAQVFDALPSVGAGGNVLVTSRHRSGWNAIGEEVGVPVWSRQEGRSFLIQRLGGDDADAAEQVSAALGDLPLALEQAAAYSAARSLSVRDYLERLKAEAPSLFEQGKPVDYEHTVATTWRLAFEQLEQHEATAALLYVCAYLGADEIPRSLFEGEAFRSSFNATSPGAPDDAIANAQRFSLIEASGATLRMHRLVQAVARTRREEAGGRRWAAVAVRVACAAFDLNFDIADAEEQMAALLPHALAALDHASHTHAENRWTADLAALVGAYLLNLHDAVAAERLLEHALKLARRFPASPAAEADLLLRLGDAQQLLGRPREAFQNTQAGYLLAQRTVPRTPQAGKSLAWLGFARCEVGDFNTGIAEQERALRLVKRVSPPGSVAVIASNLAVCLVEDERWQRALEIADFAVKMEREVFGPEHIKTAGTMLLRASALYGLGETEAGITEGIRAMSIAEANLPAGDLRLGNFLHGLGDLLVQHPEREQEGEHMLARAVEMLTDAYGRDHLRPAFSEARLGAAMVQRGAPAGVAMLRHALGVLSAAYPEHQPSIRRARAALDAADARWGGEHAH
jgi:tetratricopeptide (TPR) repeat protein